MDKDYYLVLGVNRTAGAGRIKRAYRELAKRYHPDSGSGSDAARFREVRRAYETLSDIERRRCYDAELRQQQAVPPPRPARARAGRRRGAPLEPVTAESDAGPIDDPETVYFDVVLSAAEASAGGVFPIAVPVTTACPRCGGGWERVLCAGCGGSGTVTGEWEVGLVIPPGVRSGIEVTLGSGRAGCRVHVRVRVAPPM
jgi:DnaJ-class molecular chaperone